MKIIVAKEKHSTRYLDASTDKAFAGSALKLLTERWNEGYWYPPPDEAYPRVDAPSDELAASARSDPYIAQVIEQRLRLAKSRADQRRLYEQWHQEVDRIVSEQDTSFRGRWPRAWIALREREGYEYEGVELETVET